MRRFVLLRLVLLLRWLVGRLRFLAFLLLSLLQLLLLLPVFLLELLELLLLSLVDLLLALLLALPVSVLLNSSLLLLLRLLLDLLTLRRLVLFDSLPSCVVSIILLNPLLLLWGPLLLLLRLLLNLLALRRLVLIDSLPSPVIRIILLDLLLLLVLLLAELFHLLLMPLVKLRIGVVRPVGVVRPRRRWTIVVHPRIARVARRVAAVARGIAGVTGSVAAVTCLVRWLIRWPVRRIRWRSILHRRWAAVVVLHVAAIVLDITPIILDVAPIVSHVPAVVLRVARIVLDIAGVVPPVGRIVRRVVDGPIRLSVSRRVRLYRRSDLDVGTRLLGVFHASPAHLGDGRRPAAVLSNLLLLFHEGYRSGRRWRLGHHRTFLEPRLRPWRNRTARPNHASLLRRHCWRSRIDLRSLNFPAIHPHHVVSDRLRRREILLRRGSYAIRRGLVYVPDVGDVFVDDDGVVVIVHHRGVHRGVGDVHVVDVGAVHAIRGHVDFTWRKREPGNADSTAAAHPDANAEVRPADPGDQRGSVNRAYISDTYDGTRRARYPAPNSANRNPTAVVKWRKAPGSIIYPCPAPGRNPHPVAVAIGRPADDSRVWKPNRAVLGHLAPASVFVEIFIANHVGRDIAGGFRVILAAVTVTAPVVEVVIVIAESLNVGVELVDSGKRAGFSRMNGVSGTAAGDFALTVADNDEGGIAGFVDVDFVVAGAKDGKGEIRCINLESFVVFEPPHAHVQGAFGDPDLRHTVVEIQERKTGVAGKTNRRGADVQLGERTVVGPKLVTCGNRTVDDRGNPIVGACWIK